MATAVSSSTKIATATAMLAVVLVARTSRLTISKPHALRNPGSPHLQSTVSLSRVEPPSPSSFPPRLSLNHDRHPSGDKQKSHPMRESEGQGGQESTKAVFSLKSQSALPPISPPGGFCLWDSPTVRWSFYAAVGGPFVSDAHTKTWAKRREKEAPSWWERRHGGFDLARAFSTRFFSFIFSVDLLALVIVVLGHGQRIIDQS